MNTLSWQNAMTFCLILAILLVMFSLCSPALAAGDFSNSELPVLASPTFDSVKASGLLVSDSGSTSFKAVSNTSAVYAFAVPSTSFVYFVSTSSGARVNGFYIRNSNGANYGSDGLVVDTASNGLFYKGMPNMSPVLSIPSFSSLSDGLTSFDSFINSPPVVPQSLDYTLPPGNVAYIPISNGQSSAITYTLTTTFYMAFGNNDTSRINQVVTVMSALPSSTNNLAPSAPKIPWTNNGNVNLLGVSANKIYHGSIPSNLGGQYLVVVNPMTMPSQSGLIGGDTYTNGSINISVSAVSGSPHIYPMSESLTITPGDGIGSESTYGDAGYTYEIDPETGEIIWTDPGGGSSAPVAGGNNPMPSPNTIFDWLRNISQQFSDFLRGPVQAVQVVVSAIRDFMGSFAQLYQWLPGPVYSLITSALMIALTIGVIKIFV